MNTKQYLVISGCVGGIIGSLLTALLVSPVTAQKDKFGVIECTILRVVDADGHLGVVLGVGDQGGFVNALGKGRKSATELGIDEHGGRVYTTGKGRNASAALGVSEHGGVVGVHGKGEGQAIMGINEYGNGAVSTWDKNGYRQ